MNTTEKKIHFGRVLSELRKIRSISGRELARKAEFSQSHISKFENGDIFPSEPHTERIADALDFTSHERKRLKVLRKLFNSNSTGFLTETDENFADNQLVLSELEDGAVNYKEFQTNVVPSLLRTLEYSTAISSCRHIYTGENLENEQKKTLELSDPTRKYSFIIQECALINRFTSKEVIKQQLVKLIELNSKGTFELGILPIWQKLPVVPKSSFKIFNDDLILIESSGGFFYHSSNIVIEQHEQLFHRLKSLALYEDACDRELIRILEKYIAKPKPLPKELHKGITIPSIGEHFQAIKESFSKTPDNRSKNEREPATEIYPEAPAPTSPSTEERVVLLQSAKKRIVFNCEKRDGVDFKELLRIAKRDAKRAAGDDTSQEAVLDFTITVVNCLQELTLLESLPFKLIVETIEKDGSLYTEVFPKMGLYKIAGDEAERALYKSPLFDDLQNEADQKNRPNKENSSSYPSPARNQQHYN